MEERELTKAEILEAMDAIEAADDQTAYEASLLAQAILTSEGGREGEKAGDDGD
jgi:hypothetical protein